ncbi:MAG: nucleoside hydrolase [Armatimonadota bacterium]
MTTSHTDVMDVLLSTDVGAEMDDQWAITHLTLHPRINLLGIVTTHTPYLTAQRSAEIAREVLSHLPISEKPPVIPGSSTPLESREEPQSNEGIDFILETARRYSSHRPLILLTIGAATDAASALLHDPSLAERIRMVSMAFHSAEGGGREFNVQNDPKAWQVILDSPVPLTIGPAVTCIRDLTMSLERAQTLFAPCGETGEYLVGLLRWWLETQPKVVEGVTGRSDAWPIWDEITTAHLLRLTETETRPRPYLHDNLDLKFATREGPPHPTIGWIQAVRADALWQDFIGCLRHVSTGKRS